MSKEKRRVPKLRFPGFTEDWEQRKFSEITVNIGKRNKENLNLEPYAITKDDGFIPQAEAHDEFGYMKETDRKAYNIVKPNSFGYNPARINVGSIGYYSGSEDIIVSSLYEIFQTSENIYDRFLWHWFKSKQFQNWIERLQEGSVRLYFYYDKLCECEIFIPTVDEQIKIGNSLDRLDNLITLHQRKLENLKLKKKALLQKLFPKNGEQIPELRFPGFTDDWEQRKLWELYERVNERNDGTLGRDKWISVAKMYFQDPDKVQSNNLDTRTYVMQRGDIAFEGHPNNEFKFGRFVLNDIGTGIISELFPIYRAIVEYDLNFWKYAIQLERTMAPIFAKSITSSGNSSNKLDQNHFLQQSITIPTVEEQKVIGSFLENISNLITLHQRKLEHLQLQKKALLQQMFV